MNQIEDLLTIIARKETAITQLRIDGAWFLADILEKELIKYKEYVKSTGAHL